MSLPVKIGNYRFERNLGNGTFGKVKCKYIFYIVNTDKLSRPSYPRMPPQLAAPFLIIFIGPILSR